MASVFFPVVRSARLAPFAALASRTLASSQFSASHASRAAGSFAVSSQRQLHASADAQSNVRARPKGRESEESSPMPAQSVMRQTHTKLRCPICTNQINIDYKNVQLLSQFVTDHSGMIVPRTLTGVCAKQQRKLATAIKRARAAGLMPYTYKLEKYRTKPTPIV